MISCPQCMSQKVWKDGLRQTSQGNVQRFVCRVCGFRFSENSLRASGECFGRSRIGVVYAYKAKNLAMSKPQIEDRLAGTTAEVKGKLIEFTWWLKKQGYADATIRLNVSCLRTFYSRGANIVDQESVKETIAKQTWSSNRRRNAINAYTLFLKFQGLEWEKPRCKVTRKIPFIPTEQEIDALIAGCGRKTSTFLQLLKETAMRSGEAKRLRWIDVDSQNRMITLNDPEKGSNPRMWKVSSTLIEMLNALPKSSQRVFGDSSIDSLKATLQKARTRLAAKLQNPRLQRISFHTLRHWKATMEYHKTHDVYHVKKFLDHRNLQSTEVYINVEQAIFEEQSDDEFHIKVAKEPKEVKALLEVGFEYVCKKDELLFFRKRK